MGNLLSKQLFIAPVLHAHSLTVQFLLQQPNFGDFLSYSTLVLCNQLDVLPLDLDNILVSVKSAIFPQQLHLTPQIEILPL